RAGAGAGGGHDLTSWATDGIVPGRTDSPNNRLRPGTGEGQTDPALNAPRGETCAAERRFLSRPTARSSSFMAPPPPRPGAGSARAGAGLRSKCLPTKMKATAGAATTRAVMPKNWPGMMVPRFSTGSTSEPPYMVIQNMLRKLPSVFVTRKQAVTNPFMLLG